jgi:hypothetical protein
VYSADKSWAGLATQQFLLPSHRYTKAFDVSAAPISDVVFTLQKSKQFSERRYLQ